MATSGEVQKYLTPTLGSFIGRVLVNGGKSAYEFLHWWGAFVSALAFAGVVVGVSLATLSLWLAVAIVAAVLITIIIEGARTTLVDALGEANKGMDAKQVALVTVTEERNAALAELAKGPDVTLAITSLATAQLGARTTGLQLWVTVRNLGAPTLLHSWRLEMHVDQRVIQGEHLGPQPPYRGSPPSLAERVSGPMRGEVTGAALYFALPEIAPQEFKSRHRDALFVLSVLDEFGTGWKTEADTASMGPEAER